MYALQDGMRESAEKSSAPDSSGKPTFIGLYGLPGSGKTTMLEDLQRELSPDLFAFYEGSEVIAGLIPGGLDAFRRRGDHAKLSLRQQAIMEIQDQCARNSKVGIVTGHFMFWDEAMGACTPVYTNQDLLTFTHIIYLDTPTKVIAQRLQGDCRRDDRQNLSEEHLDKWQWAEKEQMRQLCRQHQILFTLVKWSVPAIDVVRMIHDFRLHCESKNLAYANARLDEAVAAQGCEHGTMLVIDGDRTLITQDTGKLFWKRAGYRKDPLKEVFDSPFGYSYTAFRQAMLLYEEAADDSEYDKLCDEVASEVTIHPEFVRLLQLVADEIHLGAVVVTCGLRLIWDKVLEKAGLTEAAEVIGGGRRADDFVVTPAVKGALVERLQTVHDIYVWAMGDSPVDLPMLEKADQSIVVVGDPENRSKIMDEALTKALHENGLQARQLLLPTIAPPRLSLDWLPTVEIAELLSTLGQRLHVHHATDKAAAKLLMTPTRDANVGGRELRAAHHRVGWYLATQFLPEIIGLEEYPIPHVEGTETCGHRLHDEKSTAIIALMRGGEPMAFGVSEAFALARFIHAHEPTDICLDSHLQRVSSVILVDSVVNSGESILQFVRHIRRLHVAVRIVVITGVLQADCVRKAGKLVNGLAGHGRVDLVALRVSRNKYTGSRGTDTGNRLFNTTHLQ